MKDQSLLLLSTIGLPLLFGALLATAEEPQEIRSFYFGNSLTNQMMVGEHPSLAAAKGNVWVTQMRGVAGGRLQQYVDGLFPDLENLAVEPTDEKWLEARNAIEEGQWDAVELAEALGELVWDVVSRNPHSGVSGNGSSVAF